MANQDQFRDLNQGLGKKKKTGAALLLEAIDTVRSGRVTEGDVEFLFLQLLARTEEFIPEKEANEIFLRLAELACKMSRYIWPDPVVCFFHAQLGRDGLEKWLEGSGFEIVQCGAYAPGHGYYVAVKGLDPKMLANEMIAEIREFFKEAALVVSAAVAEEQQAAEQAARN